MMTSSRVDAKRSHKRTIRWVVGVSILSVLLGACGGADQAEAAQTRLEAVDGIARASVHSSRAGSPLNLEYQVALRLPSGVSNANLAETLAQALVIADEELRPSTAGGILFQVWEAELNDQGQAVTFNLVPALEELEIPLRDSQVAIAERGDVTLSADVVEAFAQKYTEQESPDVD